MELPEQLLAVGVIVIVAKALVVPEFVAVNELIFPEPLAASPIEVLLFVQLKVVPPTAPEKLTALVAVLLQSV